MKIRIDRLLVNRGLAASRERAQALILAGKVLVNGQKVEKPGTAVDLGAAVRVLGQDLKYVSRGGLKLEAALDHWGINVDGRVCMDVGTSTGGFTDCLLQRGAKRVIAVDTGYGQIDARLRRDPRLRLLERTNARYLTAAQVGAPVDLVAIDVSFISATLVLPNVVASCQWTAELQVHRDRPAGDHELIVLVKPQFEVGRKLVGKGGIVRDAVVQAEAVEKVRRSVVELDAMSTDVIESPILGAEGNREWLLYAKFA
jgi:23S rRNA (cytidine1920-2'-O)/16S rRNA (cytidine1409-2'-O)-methyltransferase